MILACGCLAYANSFSGVLVFDDEPAIVENPHIRHLWPLRDGLRAPEGTTVSGRPVVSLSLAINYAVAPADARDQFSIPAGGASPEAYDRVRRNLWGYHALNLAIHLAAALALFGVLRRTPLPSPPRPGVREAAGAARPAADGGRASASAAGGLHDEWLAVAVALVWTVHPLQTSAVTYVVQRAESLMGLFLLLTLYCAIRAWSGSWRWTAAAILTCALGMGTKETMVAAPVVVLLWDWIFASRSASLRTRLALYASLAATWIVLALLVSGGYRPNAAGFGFAEWPWWTYLLTQAGVSAHYLRLSVAPWPLVLDYGWPPARLVDVVPQLVLIVLLAGATAVGIARRLPWAFAGGSFFLILAPTSSVLPIVTEAAAEHRMYVPLAAVLAVLIVGGYRLVARWQQSTHFATAGDAHSRTAGHIGTGLTIVVIVCFGALTHARNARYQDQEGLWLDTVQKRPLNVRARNNYATLLLEGGRYAEAEAEVRVATQVDPRSVEAQQTLGVALCAQSRCDEGMAHLETAATLAPASPDVQRNLAEAHASRGEMAAAVTAYTHALEARPDDIMLLNRAGWILATDVDGVRDGARAVALAERAVRLTTGTDVESLDTLAAAYAAVGRFDAAVVAASDAWRLAPSREPAIVPELEQRLALYEARRPFRARR